MQSSSRLFPVSLISAEWRGDLSEDIYRLKPGNSTDPSVELALTRLGLATQPERGVPVVLLHGSFSNRRFWYSPKGLGVAPYLARAGFDVWLVEMRGHGLSPRNLHYKRNNVSDYARYDLPAVNAFVREQTAQLPHWVGHSLGGVTLAAALGGGYLNAESVASAALFGSQVSARATALRIAPLRWAISAALRGFPYLSGRRLKRGPEDEPIGVAAEVLRWQAGTKRFGDAQGNWWQGLEQVSVPLLAVAGAGDVLDPVWACQQLLEQTASEHNRFVLLGTEQGFSQNYGHIEMLVSKAAQKEVWPLLVDWLQRFSVSQVDARKAS